MPVPKNITQDIYYKHSDFWVLNGSGEFSEIGTAVLKSFLSKRLAASIGTVSRELIGDAIEAICLNQSIDNVFPYLPGYPVGIIPRTKILVPVALKPIEPIPGDSPMIENILSQLLATQWPEQLEYFLGWLQIGSECLRQHSTRPGQVVFLCGPQDAGKTFVQKFIVTPLFGGEAADPYQYVTGRTPFSANLFRAMHLQVSDQKNPRNREDVREFIRQVASNEAASLHPKNKDARDVDTLRRMTVSCNLDERDLAIVPPLDGLEDKVMLFKTGMVTMPMSTGTEPERLAFAAAIRAEIPHFVDNLLRYRIPIKLRHQRFGIRGYLQPDLKRLIHKLEPEAELLELTRDAKKAALTFSLTDVTANEIHKAIYEQGNLRPRLLDIARGPVRFGQLLSKLADRNDGTVVRGAVVRGSQEWTVNI